MSISQVIPKQFITRGLNDRNVKMKACNSFAPQVKIDTYSQFVKNLKQKDIDMLQITQNSNVVRYSKTDGSLHQTNAFVTEKLLEDAISHDIDVVIQETPMEFMILQFLIPFLIFWFIFSRMNPQNMFKNQTFDVVQSDVRFDDVAGIDECKIELQELVQFLKVPKKFDEIGAKIPKGCLLEGPPGTGKTLLAKAIAGESNVPFISCSASQFIELFVGLGASRIRGLFKQAREKTPCIIFIDEIDAIGKKRNTTVASGGGNDEREQTLNQLLTEMDGFSESSGIIVIGATNRSDTLDDALLRPGRFDRKISVPIPDQKGRLEILKTKSKNRQFEDESILEKFSKKTIGFSGAELENLLNESAILAVKNDRLKISTSDLENAYEKVTIGLPRNTVYSDETKKLIAYHEAGHALVGLLLDCDKVDKVSILPRGKTGGVTTFIPKDTSLYSKKYLFDKLMIVLGGHASEEIVFGDNITTGAHGDFKQATQIARTIIANGFSEKIGKIDIDNVSELTRKNIDDEIRYIIDIGYTKTKSILIEHKHRLDEIAFQLIEKETIRF